MAAKRSKTVDDAIRECFARLATQEFKRAKLNVDTGNPHAASNCMGWVESWLDKAGAHATRRNFSAYA